MFCTVEEALSDIREGKIIIVVDDEDRENEGDFFIPAEVTTAEAINFMIKHGRGLVCAPVSREIARRLGLEGMVKTNTDRKETAFTVSIDHVDCTTGISAYERANTIQKMADADSRPSDFTSPGHIFPLLAKDKGVLERMGHTEAAVDLSRLAGFKEAGVICEIINDDGTMARQKDLFELAGKFDMKILTIESLVEYRKKHEMIVTRTGTASLPTEHGIFEIYGYEDYVTGKEHIALVKGDLSSKTPLVRVHSECLTGDVLGSLRCDCGNQLKTAMKRINEYGCGVLIYLRQEGRGIGLLNKIRAYELQDKGMDTVEANLALGFEEDEREYSQACAMLKDLGVSSIVLMTNNPDKIDSMARFGISVEKAERIEVGICEHNVAYLKTKKDKMGHILDKL
ncbi:riboflavin biosynthesis protein RibBA [Peptoclostridium acidaminophilum DSM 3953]|uniref:Riboflavin biosynthesis protein RibBA n=1 Tax=Peptoclostridium acidaminophilum DSM 3953 TaxID=1286171 RepID=W8T5D4_PEPAC|nr:bifunctional 3,4-dihydroxy-2-butanone-4-phosphate synthase/GTP cyclohydrolase II [Peptoclostridium acidaminophilum]AHM56964.1 riboflavin biosynthesis protein RibBA [Peptoclostridium acidaminophilum DSM 3953]